MDQPIRWGVLATGFIASAFVDDLRLLPDAQVIAVGSRSPVAAERFAAAHGIPRAHGSWQALAEDTDVDVVYVATPHSAHHSAAATCLRAGRAVLVEKPLTVDLAQATDLVELARDTGRFLMEGMWTRCFPAVRRALELVADGAIGPVTAVQADFGFPAPDDPAHRLHARELAGGALLDVGVYPVTIAHLFLGAPDEILAWADLGPQGTDRNTAMVFGYTSGAVATLSCSLVGDTPWVAAVIGTKGRIEFPRPFFRPDRFTLHRGDDSEVVTLPYPGRGYQVEAAEVQRCLRHGLAESPLVPWSASLSVMATLDRVRAQIGVTYE
jgi:predicted dehydrogenase